jgi:LuxR family transcriptional regulator, maltose regulon positive regulatory protein
VLLLMDGRFTNKEIARLVGITEEAVKQHAMNVYSKLQVTGRRDAVSRAYELGLLRAEDRETPASD